MNQLVKALDLTKEIEMTAADYYASQKGLNERYLREIVQSATRVNYGQNLDELHALGSQVRKLPDNMGFEPGFFHLLSHL